MAPKVPNISDNNHGGGSDNDLKITDLAQRPASHKDPGPNTPLREPEDAREVGVFRQVALSAGLLASDGGLVFMQLMMLPTLQTLGVPVTSVTLPGCLSGTMAMFSVPLLGCISDRGNHPQGRKKPAVVFSAFVFITGFCLVISGCGLHAWSGARVKEVEGQVGNPGLASNVSFMQNVTGEGYEGASNDSDPSSTHLSLAVELVPATALGGSAQELEATTSTQLSKETLPETSSAQIKLTQSTGVTSFPADDQEGGNDEEDDEGEEVSSLPGWMTDPLGLSIPLVGLLSIVGFAFIDMGNDLNNSSQKSFVLASTSHKQHVSLLVVGVQMSALGGCVAAALGVTDVASYFTQGTILDNVPGKTLLQCSIFIVLTVLCVLITILSVPSSHKKQEVESPFSEVTSPKHPNYGALLEQEEEEEEGQVRVNPSLIPRILLDSDSVAEDALHSSHAHADMHSPKGSHHCLHDSTSISFSRIDDSVSDYHFSTSCESRMSTDTVRLLNDPCRHRSLNLSHKSTEPETRRAKLLASNSIVYYAFEDHGASSSETDCERGEMSTSVISSQVQAPAEASVSGRRCWMNRQSLRLALICVSMFFMCGAWQSFNVCATDYLGKVIYGGDPDAAPDSQSYVAYQQGLQTGSLGVLLLNGVYVVANFMQKKMLTTAGPKVECFLVCGLQVGCLLAMLLTDHVVAYYVTSTVVGIFRSAMYTIPFMLANEICQEAAKMGAGEGKANVGSTMALVTSMIPLSNILVSSLTGPLIYSSGNPAAPLYYTIGATAIAAVVFVFT